MNLINRQFHGVLDYVVGLALIFAPRIFGLDTTTAEGQVPVALGIAAIVYSLLTRYELGLIRVLPFRTHLTLDMVSGLLLALSPWLFAFSDGRWVPHVIVGILEIAVAMMTRKDPMPARADPRVRTSTR